MHGSCPDRPEGRTEETRVKTRNKRARRLAWITQYAAKRDVGIAWETPATSQEMLYGPAKRALEKPQCIVTRTALGAYGAPIRRVVRIAHNICWAGKLRKEEIKDDDIALVISKLGEVKKYPEAFVRSVWDAVENKRELRNEAHAIWETGEKGGDYASEEIEEEVVIAGEDLADAGDRTLVGIFWDATVAYNAKVGGSAVTGLPKTRAGLEEDLDEGLTGGPPERIELDKVVDRDEHGKEKVVPPRKDTEEVKRRRVRTKPSTAEEDTFAEEDLGQLEQKERSSSSSLEKTG